MNTGKLSIRDFCQIGIFTAVISILAQIMIPMPTGVPMTLQTFAIALAGVVLGPRKGMISTVIYILLGAIGVPVFTEFSGGLSVVFGYTGGFIISFPIMAFAAGFGAGKNKLVETATGIVVGVVVNFICGMFMFKMLTGSSYIYAFGACVLPFLPTSVIQIVLVVVLGGRMKHALVKSRVLV